MEALSGHSTCGTSLYSPEEGRREPIADLLPCLYSFPEGRVPYEDEQAFDEILRFAHDEIQASLDEIFGYASDEMKSVLNPDEV